MPDNILSEPQYARTLVERLIDVVDDLICHTTRYRPSQRWEIICEAKEWLAYSSFGEKESGK